MSIEDALREAARKGLTHLSLYPTPSEDGKTTYWRATATPSTGHAYVWANEADPVEAVAQALHKLPQAKRRQIVGSGKENQGTLPIDAIPGKETEGVTATVKPNPTEMDTWLPKP